MSRCTYPICACAKDCKTADETTLPEKFLAVFVCTVFAAWLALLVYGIAQLAGGA